ncbi:MAG: MobB mobilization protein [Synergistaceae bacterium]|nr:MobB mobilization protein [Synergistaceae bacterium]
MADAKTKRIHFRMTEQEHLAVETAASVAGVSVSEYMRRRALGHRVAAKADLAILSELRRLGGMLKMIHNETHGRYSRDTADAIQSLGSYARRLERRLSQDDREDPAEEA